MFQQFLAETGLNLGFYVQMPLNKPFVVKFRLKCFDFSAVAEGFYIVKSNAVGLDDISPRFINIIPTWIIHHLLPPVFFQKAW